jgi:hypothetical protein
LSVWGIKIKKLILAILLSTLASPTWATTYYLATAAGGGSDSNNGTSAGTPWLTPKHAVNCGDVILAAPSTAYVATNFHGSSWGKVTCPAGNNVAWLKCATFDACKISVTDGSTYGMAVSMPYWGVQGWEITITRDSLDGAGCITVSPSFMNGDLEVHHVIIANNVINVCSGGGGIITGHGGSVTTGWDYVAFIGNIVYNAANGSSTSGCFSGLDLFEPGPLLDSVPGTHIYAAGNFSFGNIDNNPCNTGGGVGAPSDGEGLIIDTPDLGGGGVGIATPVWTANGALGAFSGTMALKPSSTAAMAYVRHTAQCAIFASTCTASITPTSGDVLITYITTAGTSATTYTPSGCGTWTQQGSTDANGDSFWTAPINSTGVCNVHATGSGSQVVIFMVWDGVNVLNMVDAGPAFSTPGAGGAETFNGTSVSTVTQSDLIVTALSLNDLNTATVNPGFISDYAGLISTFWSIGQGHIVAFPVYTQQIVIDNNIFVSNGGRGLEVFKNTGGTVHAPIYFRHNTIWGNNTDVNNNAGADCAETILSHALNTQVSYSISMAAAATGCQANAPTHAYYVDNGDATDHVFSNVGYSASGNNKAAVSSGGFTFGADNLFGTNPNFTNAVAPSAPSCSGTTGVPNCMATVIANFSPTNASAVAYGYQIPSTTSIYDPLYPAWLCTVTNLPAGLVTPGCLAQSSLPASPTITGVKVQ